MFALFHRALLLCVITCLILGGVKESIYIDSAPHDKFIQSQIHMSHSPAQLQASPQPPSPRKLETPIASRSEPKSTQTSHSQQKSHTKNTPSSPTRPHNQPRLPLPHNSKKRTDFTGTLRARTNRKMKEYRARTRARGSVRIPRAFARGENVTYNSGSHSLSGWVIVLICDCCVVGNGDCVMCWELPE